MPSRLGMDPQQVIARAGVIRSAQGSLEHTAQSVEHLVSASLNPLSYAVQPGGLIIAPWSIAGTNFALAQLRAAIDDLPAFVERALREAEQQQAASVSGAGARHNNSHTVRSREDALQKLFKDGLSSQEIADQWRSSGLTTNDLDNLSYNQLAVLSMMDGLPGDVRDRASRLLLAYAKENPREAHQLLGFDSEDSETSLELFTQQIAALDEALQESEDRSRVLAGRPVVQLLGLGNHDGALVSAISLGDIDTATHVAVNVPGMNSDLDGIANGAAGGAAVYTAAKQADQSGSYAVVTWYGYNSPGLNEVRSMDRADAGAKQLTSFLDGIHDSRTASQHPIAQFSVLAHSYGSTTAAEALKNTRVHVDDFVMYGSAGLKNGTAVSDLHAQETHATAASGDNLRWAGYAGGNRTDPHDISEVKKFSAEGVNGRDRVTAHDMFTEDGGGSFWNWGGKRGYLTEGTNSLYEIGQIVAGK